MYQLRIYAMRTADALEHYATVHWPRHIPSLRAFGVTTNGIWTQPDGDAHRLVALISYPDGINPASTPPVTEDKAPRTHRLAHPPCNAVPNGYSVRAGSHMPTSA